jgi:hypothetical protein
MRDTVLKDLYTRIKYNNIVMKKFTMVTTSLTLVVATIFVAGTLLFPYNYAMAGKNHDDSKSNTANGRGDSIANMGINGNGHPSPHPHPHPPHTAVNTTRSNIKNGSK